MGLCQYIDLCFHASSLPCLHIYFLACHPYILLHFLCFLYSCFYTFLISVTTRLNSKKSSLLIFFHMKTDNCLRQLHDHPSITEAAGRLFHSIAISNQLNAAPYLRRLGNYYEKRPRQPYSTRDFTYTH